MRIIHTMNNLFAVCCMFTSIPCRIIGVVAFLGAAVYHKLKK